MFAMAKLGVKKRVERFMRWRILNLYKLYYMFTTSVSLKIKLLYVTYIIINILLGFVPRGSSSPLIEKLYTCLNRIMKSIISRGTRAHVKYEVGGKTVVFSAPDLEGLEIVMPIFEYTNMKLLFYHVKKFNGKGVLIDVESHVGKYAVTFAKLFPSLSVIALEPDRLNYLYLLRNIVINNLMNITPINKALWSREGDMQLILSNYSGRHRVLSNVEYGGFTKTSFIKATTLDDVVKSIHPQLLERNVRMFR